MRFRKWNSDTPISSIRVCKEANAISTVSFNNNNNNNYDNLYGAIMWPYRYKGASQATKWSKP